ncbi:MAG: hypothetical protein Q8O67_19025 [Deltaproteobacteria bacterium]|nr:hypothetical protein [Deltaproteobacteria bacterium]
MSSSGTTRSNAIDPPLEIAIGANELATQEGADQDEGVVVVVAAVTHGLPAPGRRNEVFVPWMHDKNALLLLDSALRRRHRGRLPDTLRISTGALKAFVTWQIEHAIDPARYGVRFIGTNSFRLSPHWKELIQSHLGCVLFDNYSLSEFATPATECKACGGLHWGDPPVFWEVIDLDDASPLPEKTGSTGELVLSSRAPFVTLMPLIRYRTGDVVSLGKICAVTKQRAFTFLGRRRRGVVVDGAFVLPPTLLQDVLEAFPDTERGMHPLVTLGILRSRELGLPRFVVDDDGAVLRLRFETRYHPGLYRHAAAGLVEHVRHAVLKGDAPLRGLLRRRRRRLVVEAVAPGTLAPPPDKYDP